MGCCVILSGPRRNAGRYGCQRLWTSGCAERTLKKRGKRCRGMASRKTHVGGGNGSGISKVCFNTSRSCTGLSAIYRCRCLERSVLDDLCVRRPALVRRHEDCGSGWRSYLSCTHEGYHESRTRPKDVEDGRRTRSLPPNGWYSVLQRAFLMRDRKTSVSALALPHDIVWGQSLLSWPPSAAVKGRPRSISPGLGSIVNILMQQLLH